MSKNIGIYKNRNKCRFCNDENLSTVIDFGDVPLAGAFLKEADIIDELYYPLTLQFCNKCYLLQIKEVIAADTLFKNYFYFSSSIGTLIKHCEEFADEVFKRFLIDKKQASVFEIGCNDGIMLKPFAKKGVIAVGIDPAENVVKSINTNEIKVINDFFDKKSAEMIFQKIGKFDAIVSSYSFAHIDDMESVMDGIKIILNDDGIFIFEVYYLGTLIEEMQYDNIYHEHMSYYSLITLEIFFNRFNMEIFDVKFTPGVRSGAVRFYAQNINFGRNEKSESLKKLAEEEIKKGYNKFESFQDYAKRVEKTKLDLLDLLNQIKVNGKKIVGYGASGRGTTIMNYCGIDGKYLDYVVDDAPAKKDHLTPGTHVPIHDWNYVEQSKIYPDYALLFAWSFAEEVMKRRKDYLDKGGKFIFPLPEVKLSN